MNEAIKKQWIKALRSGKYEQGKGCLRRHNVSGPDTYCCLGVLCDVLGMKWREPEDGWSEYRVGRDDSIGFLPNSALKRSGVLDHEQDALSSLNDTGSSFARIARHIEKNL